MRRSKLLVLVLSVAGLAAVAVLAVQSRSTPHDAPEPAPAGRSPLPVVDRVELQPLRLHVGRVVAALEAAGAPLDPAARAALDRAESSAEVQRILDPHALAALVVNPEARVRVLRGAARAELDEAGWRTLLLKVVNEAGSTAALAVTSPQAKKPYLTTPPPWAIAPDASISQADVKDRWLALEIPTGPLPRELSGLAVEYRVLHAYCADRDQGLRLTDHDRPDGGRHSPRARKARGEVFERAATLAFAVGGASEDLGHRSELDVLFTCRPAVDVVVRVADEHGAPSTAALVVTDRDGRTYPPRAKRIAPDFFFERQVYRHDGEALTLPPGDYEVEAGRGPEYLTTKTKLHVPTGASPELQVSLRRWIDPAALGWVSGDHHIHAAGCSHYEAPTMGVFPEDIFRHLQGEDLKVGAVLTWGPCYAFQKQFFGGEMHPLSTARTALRYDVEVSGFASHRSGHIVLLGLRDQDYPNAATVEDWPQLGTSVLRWAKSQGATTGIPHTGNGLEVPGTTLPTDELARCDGIGANEFVADVTHDLVDFVSAVDTPYVWELNLWYHVLDAGFRTRLAGETDFPCIYEDRIGHGRTYAKLADPRQVAFRSWTEALRQGRSYVSDGKSHIVDFGVSASAARVANDAKAAGDELRLPTGSAVRVAARVAARLDETPHPEIRDLPVASMPFWDLERARIDDSREVAVELVVNGTAVARSNVVADGAMREVVFDAVKVERSSWVAMRILPSSHTNPVFVVVGDKAIRTSKKRISWLRRMVDVCWQAKRATYRPSELDEAARVYQHARDVYDARIKEADSP